MPEVFVNLSVLLYGHMQCCECSCGGQRSLKARACHCQWHPYTSECVTFYIQKMEQCLH